MRWREEKGLRTRGTYRRVQVPNDVLRLVGQLLDDARVQLGLLLAHGVGMPEDLALLVGNDVAIFWGGGGGSRGVEWVRTTRAGTFLGNTYPSTPGLFLMRSMVSSTCDCVECGWVGWGGRVNGNWGG